MATAYELAFLSHFCYKAHTGQSTRVFEIPTVAEEDYNPKFLGPTQINSSKPGRSVWAIVSDVGLYNDMYCATFKNLQTSEIVFAFRGTRTDGIANFLTDLAIDIIHLAFRQSPYIEEAKNYLSSNITNNAIITGHSLGGYLALSMAFYFRNNRIATFNAPHVISKVGHGVDLTKAIYQDNFKTNKIISYNARMDFASGLTSIFGNGGLKMDDIIKYEKLPWAGTHGIEPMINQLKKRKGNVDWNKK